LVKRAVDFGRVLPKVVPSFFTMNPSTIIGSILTNYVGGEWQWLVREAGRDVGEGTARAVVDATASGRGRAQVRVISKQSVITFWWQ
jgi:CBS domain-containing protein